MIIPYNRAKAVEYALRWALGRNPEYFDFSSIGGDCTNFISQCLYAGSGVMNYTPVFGWYYINANDRSPSWTSVEYLYDFLVTNNTRGVFAEETEIENMMPGDVIQLGRADRFYHSLFVTETGRIPNENNIKICAHTNNAKNRILRTYNYSRIRFLHIKGVYN